MTRPTRIPASIEASPRHVLDAKLEPGLLPAGTRVYLTDVGVDPMDDYVEAARRIGEMGYHAAPHVPARRIESQAALDTRIARLVDEAGVSDVLVIAGEAERTMGPFDESLDVLRTGLLDRRGIRQVGVAGHPEGNTAYKVDPHGVLAAKAAFATESDAEFRIVTQFGFDGEGFVRWARHVAQAGIDLPIHLGVAGPAKVTTLLKFAAMCGVGNSLNFFRRRFGAVAALATRYSPEEVVGPIERAWAAEDGTLVAQIHVFPFGGIRSAAEWLEERGSLQVADTAVPPSPRVAVPVPS